MPQDYAQDTEREIRELRESISVLNETRRRLAALSEKLVFINRISQELNTLDLERLSSIATRLIPELVGARYGSLYLYNYDSRSLTLKKHNHPEPITDTVSVDHHPDTVMAHALRGKSALLVRNIDEHEKEQGVRFDRAFADKYATRSFVSVPLISGNFIVGVLNLADKLDGGFFDEVNDLPVIDQLARVVAMAIRNCRLFAVVQEQARTDGLTRLANYRAFHEALQAEIHRHTRYHRPFTLLLLDIDGFKEINDKHGHPAGDYVLTTLATLLLESLRREDLAARYGGDEIALILPETDAKSAEAIASRLFRLIRGKVFRFGGRTIPVSISIGIAEQTADGSLAELVEIADKALYQAKRKGKNRCEIGTR